MKLLTHNMLTSKCLKAVVTGYPLDIEVRDVKVSTVEFNQEFITRIIPKVNWECLWNAANGLGYDQNLPKAVPDNFEQDEEFLKKAHHVLLEIEIINGGLICPETKKTFPISDGIVNMLVNEDQI